MRSHNKILAVAITTALSASFSNLYAAQSYIEDCKSKGNLPTQFENVGNTGANWANCVIREAGEGDSIVTLTSSRPKDVFDFTAGQSVVYEEVGTTGVSYAAELFGGTGLILPTPISTGLSPDYLGVIYTIDGDIKVNFDVTFTLSNATFAENPILGVRDDKGIGYNLDAAVTAGDIVVSVTGLAAENVFRFETREDVYLAEGPASFHRLGVLSANPAIKGAQGAELTASKVYPNLAAVATPGVLSAAVATIVTGLAAGATSPATISVSAADAAKLKAGWTYACSSSSAASPGNHLFSVAPAATGVVTITAKAAAYSDGWASVGAGGWGDFSNTSNNTASFGNYGAECPTNGFIYRVHVMGDTVISLESTPTTTFAKDAFYTFDVATPACNLADIPNLNPNIPILGPTSYKVTAVDSTNNLITIEKGLANPLCATMKGYKTAINVGDNWKPGGPMNPTPPITSGAASGKNVASFTMNAKDLNALEGGDQLMLLYKLSNVGILADTTQKVNMTIDLQTGGAVDTIVNPQRTVTVATSAKALDMSLTSLGEGSKLNISVSSGNLQFSGELGDGFGFVSNTIAKIGQLKINNLSTAKMADAKTNFAIGDNAVKAELSKLVITGGQFSASKSMPGSVDLHLSTGSSIKADEITMDLDGAWQATWNLNSSELSSIAPSADIEIVADGVNEINPVENPPLGNLTIDFDNGSYKDITIEAVELRKITKDGNVCTVYNVPPPSNGVMGADVVSIRVTNDSAIAGKLTGKFFGMDGTLMWSGDLMEGNELPPGVTTRLENDGLAKLMGITWEGRGVLQINSTIPEMEVMALIRQNGLKFAPLSNLSTGARGTSCTQQ